MDARQHQQHQCAAHPGARGYRDPANCLWRCIACEEAGIAHELLDWRDYDVTSMPPEDKRRLEKRLAMRRREARRKVEAGA